MRPVASWAVVLGLVGVAAVAVHALRPDPAESVDPVGGDRPPDGPRSVPRAVDDTVPSPPPEAGDPPYEAEWATGERFPERAPLVPPVLVPVGRDVLSGPTEVSGDVLIDLLVASRRVFVRWDAQELRVRVRRAVYPRPNPHVGSDGGPGFMLDEVRAILRAQGYTSRLEGPVLRIGGSDAYPEAPPPGPSPR